MSYQIFMNLEWKTPVDVELISLPGLRKRNCLFTEDQVLVGGTLDLLSLQYTMAKLHSKLGGYLSKTECRFQTELTDIPTSKFQAKGFNSTGYGKFVMEKLDWCINIEAIKEHDSYIWVIKITQGPLQLPINTAKVLTNLISVIQRTMGLVDARRLVV